MLVTSQVIQFSVLFANNMGVGGDALQLGGSLMVFVV
jgi:hypothetical protein